MAFAPLFLASHLGLELEICTFRQPQAVLYLRHWSGTQAQPSTRPGARRARDPDCGNLRLSRGLSSSRCE